MDKPKINMNHPAMKFLRTNDPIEDAEWVMEVGNYLSDILGKDEFNELISKTLDQVDINKDDRKEKRGRLLENLSKIAEIVD